MEELNILFEDGDILVAVKPAGVESESAKGLEPDMVNRIRNHIRKTAPGAGGGVPYVGVVHRLDKPVEGIMVFAKTKEAAAALSRQMAEGKMKKIYRAVLCGVPSAPSGTFTDFILQDNKSNRSEVTAKETPGAKRAELKYRVTGKKYVTVKDASGKPGKGEQISEVEIELLTGRHHQIRVQFAAHKLPLLGDRKYNPAYLKTDAKGRFLTPEGICGTPEGDKLALCAVSLSFVHPKSRKPLHFVCKPTGDGWEIL